MLGFVIGQWYLDPETVLNIGRLPINLVLHRKQGCHIRKLRWLKVAPDRTWLNRLVPDSH
jgi:hypothetical protein